MTLMNLVVVAHPDDEILGFGATGARLSKDGERVKAVIACGNAEARTQRPADPELAEDIEKANSAAGFEAPVLGSFPNIRLNTVPHIELVQFIEEAIIETQPSRIFTHHPGDMNDDHREVARACLAAARLFQRRPELKPVTAIHLMEIQSSTDWALDPTQTSFTPNLFIEAGDYIETKLEALRCYRNVMRPYPHPRSQEAIKGIAAYRGGQCGYSYAEAFQTVFKRGL